MLAWSAAGACAALGVAATPVLSRWALSAPDRGVSRWWLPARASTPTRSLIIGMGAAAAAAGALCGEAVGWSAALPAFAVLGLLAAVLAVVDLATHRLPDRLTGLAAVGLIVLLGAATAGGATIADWLRAVAAGAATFAAFAVVRLVSPRGLGFGDVKLAGVLGTALGWQSWSAAIPGLLAGFVIGALAALALLALGRVGLRTAVPFGPSLILGALLVCAAYGPAV